MRIPLAKFSLFVRCSGFAVCLGITASAHADDPIPKPFPPDHFDKLAAQSPFSPPTAGPVSAPAATPPVPKTFEKYTVLLLMQQGNEYVATLNNKDTSEHTRVRTNNANEEGLTLVSVEWANEPSQTKVTLSKGTEFGVIGFDPSGVAAPAPGVMAPGGGGRQVLRPVPPTTPFRPPPGLTPGNGGPSTQPGGNNVRRQSVIRNPGANPPNVQRPGGPPIPGAKPLAGDDDDD